MRRRDIPVMLPGYTSTVRITRAEFEAMIRPMIQQTIELVERTMRAGATSTPAPLHAALLVGGSSRIPLVSQMVGEHLDVPVRIDAHPKLVTARGAARKAAAGGPSGPVASEGGGSRRKLLLVAGGVAAVAALAAGAFVVLGGDDDPSDAGATTTPSAVTSGVTTEQTSQTSAVELDVHVDDRGLDDDHGGAVRPVRGGVRDPDAARGRSTSSSSATTSG